MSLLIMNEPTVLPTRLFIIRKPETRKKRETPISPKFNTFPKTSETISLNERTSKKSAIGPKNELA